MVCRLSLGQTGTVLTQFVLRLRAENSATSQRIRLLTFNVARAARRTTNSLTSYRRRLVLITQRKPRWQVEVSTGSAMRAAGR